MREQKKEPEQKLEKLSSHFAKRLHPADWSEMKRYHREKPEQLKIIDDELYELFHHTPEALNF